MANRFIGGVLSSRPQANTPFVSRASTGTYFNSSGTLVTAPINQPRLNYNFDGTSWRNPSLLIEPASTNFLTYSEDFSNGVWASNNSLTTNQAVAPDGTTTADLMYPTSTGSWSLRYQQNPTGTTANTTGYTYTISVFAKASGKSWLFLGDDNSTTRGVWFNVSTGVIGTRGSGMLNGRIEPEGNGWYRCQVTYITAGVVRNLMAITDADNSASVTASGSNGILIWGAQLEERFTATSYIPTTTSLVTRAADIVGPYSTGIYRLEDRQNNTANDDQFTVTSFTTVGSTTWTAPLDVTSVEVLVVAGVTARTPLESNGMPPDVPLDVFPIRPGFPVVFTSPPEAVPAAPAAPVGDAVTAPPPPVAPLADNVENVVGVPLPPAVPEDGPTPPPPPPPPQHSTTIFVAYVGTVQSPLPDLRYLTSPTFLSIANEGTFVVESNGR